MNEEQKNVLKKLLSENIMQVEFEKADGSLRKMKCTLNEKFLPAPVASDEEVNRNRKPNEEVQVVWDVESNGWRSFRYDRIKSMNPLEGV